MSTIDYEYARSMATQLATFEVQAAINKADRNEANYQTRLSALTSLETAVRKFSSSVTSLNGAGKTLLTNSATLSSESFATANVGTSAVAGSYQFFVEQLASKHQLAVSGLTEADVATTGSLVLEQNGTSFAIDLSTIDTDGSGTNSLEEVAAAINAAADNTGVSATLVRSNGEVSLVLGSEESGADNAITLSTVGTGGGAFDSAITGATELAVARDAVVRLGGEAGMVLTSTSNTFENVIDGVSLTFNQTHSAGATPLTVDIGRDDSTTKDNVQGFLTAINELFSSFDTLTAAGGETGKRGPLAGDASIRSIESMINRVIRDDYNGSQLASFGIVSDRYGKLTIDSERFEQAVADNPEGLEALFTGDGGLLETLDTNLDQYTGSTNNVFKTRKETLNSMLRRVDEQFDKIQVQYDNYYARYLNQYTNMMQTMSAMEQTFGLF